MLVKILIYSITQVTLKYCEKLKTCYKPKVSEERSFDNFNTLIMPQVADTIATAIKKEMRVIGMKAGSIGVIKVSIPGMWKMRK